jgi:protein SCO1/2
MKKIFYIIILVLSASIGAIAFQYLTKLPEPEHALYYKTPRTIPAFELTDEQGSSFSNNELKEQWSFIFLGYTSCPDVCPITLQNLNAIYDELKSSASNSQILLVTADPKRDTIDKLAQYIAYFNPEFKALRAEHDILFPFTRSLGLMYSITDDGNAKSAGQNDESYWVDHSASIILINPHGKIAAIFKPEQAIGEVPSINSEKLLSDFKKIVALN